MMNLLDKNIKLLKEKVKKLFLNETSGLDILQMNRIDANIWDGNDASKKLAQKLGFVQEGIQRKARIKNGKLIDLYCYGLLKEEWENSYCNN